MLCFVVVATVIALVYGQDPTTEVPNTTHVHHTQAPFVNHTFDLTEISWFQDLAHNFMVLKTKSGCYLYHLTATQVEHTKDPEHLLHLEGNIIHRVRTAKHFTVAQNTAHLKDEIKSACTEIYHYHH